MYSKCFIHGVQIGHRPKDRLGAFQAEFDLVHFMLLICSQRSMLSRSQKDGHFFC